MGIVKKFDLKNLKQSYIIASVPFPVKDVTYAKKWIFEITVQNKVYSRYLF